MGEEERWVGEEERHCDWILERRGSEKLHCKLNQILNQFTEMLPVHHLPEDSDFFAGMGGIREVVLGRLRAGLHESREAYWEEGGGGGQGGERGESVGQGGERGESVGQGGERGESVGQGGERGGGLERHDGERWGWLGREGGVELEAIKCGK